MERTLPKMTFHLVYLFIIVLAVSSQEQEDALISPCPNVFEYRLSTEEGRWFGYITLPANNILQSLDIMLDRKADLLGNWIGEVSSSNNIDFKIQTGDIMIYPGQATRFFVRYNPLVHPIPKLKTIRINGMEICSSANPLSITENSEKIPDTPQTDVEQAVTDNPSETDQVHCGSLAPTTIPSEKVERPWHASLYLSLEVTTKYICAGTLVSTRHVMTVGHCVTYKGTNKVIKRSDMMVHLGKHNFRISTKGVQIRLVSHIHKHPQYDGTKLWHNLGIIVLRDPVTFTEWVRPACLWPEKDIDFNIVGLKGSVAGWSVRDSGSPMESLTVVEVPVVSTLTCIRSHSAFYTLFTSDNTFCAGNNQTGPPLCKFGSGGGMVFELDGYWHLRGVVSVYMALPGTYTCDPTRYVVYTDIARYLPWIIPRLT